MPFYAIIADIIIITLILPLSSIIPLSHLILIYTRYYDRPRARRPACRPLAAPVFTPRPPSFALLLSLYATRAVQTGHIKVRFTYTVSHFTPHDTSTRFQFTICRPTSPSDLQSSSAVSAPARRQPRSHAEVSSGFFTRRMLARRRPSGIETYRSSVAGDARLIFFTPADRTANVPHCWYEIVIIVLLRPALNASAAGEAGARLIAVVATTSLPPCQRHAGDAAFHVTLRAAPRAAVYAGRSAAFAQRRRRRVAFSFCREPPLPYFRR